MRERVWAAAVVASLLALPATTALPLPGAAAWDVASDVTLEGVPMVLATDVIVEDGGALRLKGVSATVAAPINVTVRAGGLLELVDGAERASGATVATRVSGPFQYEVYVAPGGALLADHAVLVAAHVTVAGDATLRRGAALDASLASLVDVLGGGALDVDGAAFDRAGGAAVFVHPGGAARLANATIGQTGDYGLHVERATARVENSSFGASLSYAVYSVGGSLTMVDTTLRGHCGLFLVDGTTGALERNDVRTLDHGFTLADVSASPPTIAHNAFAGTQTAILLVDALPSVHNNSFEGNAVALSSTAPASWPRVDARWNWWGDAGGPGAGDVSGDVDTAPWLASAP